MAASGNLESACTSLFLLHGHTVLCLDSSWSTSAEIVGCDFAISISPSCLMLNQLPVAVGAFMLFSKHKSEPRSKTRLKTINFWPGVWCRPISTAQMGDKNLCIGILINYILATACLGCGLYKHIMVRSLLSSSPEYMREVNTGVEGGYVRQY